MDLDAQGSLGISLGLDVNNLTNTMKEVLRDDLEPMEALHEVNGAYIFPSNKKLAKIEFEIQSELGSEKQLSNKMKTISGADIMLIDSPPNLGIHSMNALVYADEIIIPTTADYLSWKGLENLIATLKQIKNLGLNDKLKINGVLITNYDARKNIQVEIKEKLKEDFGAKLYKTAIRTNNSLAEAPTQSKSIFEHKPRSNGAKDYMAVARELLKRIK